MVDNGHSPLAKYPPVHVAVEPTREMVPLEEHVMFSARAPVRFQNFMLPRGQDCSSSFGGPLFQAGAKGHVEGVTAKAAGSRPFLLGTVKRAGTWTKRYTQPPDWNVLVKLSFL